jgi:hypothetical protein
MNKDRAIATEALLELYLLRSLPDDITLITVPLKRSPYGDYSIQTSYCVPAWDLPRCESADGNIEVEHIEMARFHFGLLDIYAGYGEKTKTLIVGTHSIPR